MAGFANRLMPIRSIRTRATAKATLQTRFAQFFFEPEFGLPKADFARCEHDRECGQEAAHASAYQHLRISEVTISQPFLQFCKFHLHDAGDAGDACNIMRARAQTCRADDAGKNAPFTFR